MEGKAIIIDINIMELEQLIEDLLVTALEGGSNYWYLLSHDFSEREDKSKSIAEYVFNQVWKEKEAFMVFDQEDPASFLGFISRSRIEKAFKLLKEDHWEHMQDLITGQWDAETADVWLQLVVMEKVIFG